MSKAKVVGAPEVAQEVVQAVGSVEQDLHNLTQRFDKVRSALIAEVSFRKTTQGTVMAQQEAIAVLTKAVGELRQQVGRLALQVNQQQGETRKDKFIAALRELCAERGLPAGTQLPEAQILQRMREKEALAEQKTPMATVSQEEEALDF